MSATQRTFRFPWFHAAVYAVLCVYLTGFVAFPPRVLLIVDESRYVSQALAFASGRTALEDARVILPAEPGSVMSDYPPGTALLQTPFVWLGGWPAAAWLSVLSLVVATLVTMRWLREQGRPPGFALLVPAYFGSLFFGRVAMSDMPSCAVVALALWLLWGAEREESPLKTFLAGIAAGLSLLFREPNVVLLAPFAVGLLIRQRVRAWPFVAGGLMGIGARLLASHALFGNALYVRDAGYGFSIGSVAHNLPQYVVILMLFFPLGLVLPFLYRGPRRAEVLTAFGAYVLLFLLFDYNSARQNGPIKGLILTSRYMLPALPLLTLMAADAFPRLLERLRPGWQGITRSAARSAAAGVLLLAFVIHPVVRRQDAEPRAVVQAVMTNTEPATPVITNHDATFKYLSPAYGPRQLILRDRIPPDTVPALLTQYGRLSLVLLDRTDSELFAKDAAENQSFLMEVEVRCGDGVTRRLDETIGAALRLRVFDLRRCSQ